MARNACILICLLIIALDITAGILGIEAEKAENKAMHLGAGLVECRNTSSQAYKLGFAALVLLSLAHVIGTLLGGFFCLWRKGNPNKASVIKYLAVAFLIISWIILVVGLIMLIIGTLSNSKSGYSCGISHHRMFTIGGILCFIHGVFTVAYYLSATAVGREGPRTTTS
ncbi:hypothetical protein ERO13_D10G016900v2 [Gossypium hirsutum]|nr:uncharacterized protein LOC107941106 [Gossypium hirsutum]KAG4124057.1 hypothetical protein ERO13_D10G016900v2 [Gossypium hirsutum]TYG48491.1 hypothetical protein ES288_D10G018700v1 [Gossypium darwinii]TYH47748.1 hypothetical protein ES332_D10G019400v1 [Gossypium tomentosum]